MSEPISQTSAGYYLQGLVQHLNSVIPKRQHKKIECWMENIELMAGAKNQGNGSDIGYMSYTAAWSFERFPFQELDPAVIMANVLAWIEDNDKHRCIFELNDPSFDVEAESDTTVMMTLEVDFIEPLMVIEDEEGVILWHGKKWKLAPYEIWVANHGEVFINNAETE
jgi:hypothetical protein